MQLAIPLLLVLRHVVSTKKTLELDRRAGGPESNGLKCREGRGKLRSNSVALRVYIFFFSSFRLLRGKNVLPLPLLLVVPCSAPRFRFSIYLE